MSERIVDAEAILWLLDSGGDVTKETIRALCKEVIAYRNRMKDLKFNGCGYNECGMAASGFSWRDGETYWKIGDPEPEEDE